MRRKSLIHKHVLHIRTLWASVTVRTANQTLLQDWWLLFIGFGVDEENSAL